MYMYQVQRSLLGTHYQRALPCHVRVNSGENEQIAYDGKGHRDGQVGDRLQQSEPAPPPPP